MIAGLVALQFDVVTLHVVDRGELRVGVRPAHDGHPGLNLCSSHVCASRTLTVQGGRQALPGKTSKPVAYSGDMKAEPDTPTSVADEMGRLRRRSRRPPVDRLAQPPANAFLEVDGRKWRRSDPRMPATIRQELVNELMSARRAVAAAADTLQRREARQRVQDAKVALGERGRAWWLEATTTELAPRIDAAIRALLRSRQAGATICPSEPARIVDGESWRGLLATVRERAVALARAGQLVIMRNRQPASGDLTKGVLRYRLSDGSARRGAS